jgi:hypothetical protein
MDNNYFQGTENDPRIPWDPVDSQTIRPHTTPLPTQHQHPTTMSKATEEVSDDELEVEIQPCVIEMLAEIDDLPEELHNELAVEVQALLDPINARVQKLEAELKAAKAKLKKAEKAEKAEKVNDGETTVTKKKGPKKGGPGNKYSTFGSAVAAAKKGHKIADTMITVTPNFSAGKKGAVSASQVRWNDYAKEAVDGKTMTLIKLIETIKEAGLTTGIEKEVKAMGQVVSLNGIVWGCIDNETRDLIIEPFISVALRAVLDAQ